MKCISKRIQTFDLHVYKDISESFKLIGSPS